MLRRHLIAFGGMVMAGVPVAHDGITAVNRLNSVRIRRQLAPLAQELETRPDAKELARMARKIATVSAA